MARQSLRKRSARYGARVQQEFDRYQHLLRRQQIRLERGDYSERLECKQRGSVSDLLESALLVMPHGFKAVVTDTTALNKSRRAYFKICRILRVAGNRPSQSPKPVKSVLRKHERPNS